MKKSFCKYCGDVLEPNTKKCTGCGRFNGKPKKEKAANSINGNEKTSGINMSKKILALIIVLTVLVPSIVTFGITFFVYERPNGLMDVAFSAGLNDGKIIGRKDGYKDGLDVGEAQGYYRGLKNGRY